MHPLKEMLRVLGFDKATAHLSDAKFRRKFRLTRMAFRQLLEWVRPHLEADKPWRAETELVATLGVT